MTMPYSEFPGTLEEWLAGSPGAEPAPRPAPRPEPQPKMRKRPLTDADVANSLMRNMKYAHEYPGAISAPVGAKILPEEYLRNTEFPSTPLGWDPRQLTPRQRLMAYKFAQASQMDPANKRDYMRAIEQAEAESPTRIAARRQALIDKGLSKAKIHRTLVKENLIDPRFAWEPVRPRLAKAGSKPTGGVRQ